MKPLDEVCIGVAWYRPGQWSLLRSVAADADDLEETHQQWLAGATNLLEDLRRRGIRARKVDMDVPELLAWCRRRGQPLDSKARSTYTAEKLRAGANKPIPKRKPRPRRPS